MRVLQRVEAGIPRYTAPLLLDPLLLPTQQTLSFFSGKSVEAQFSLLTFRHEFACREYPTNFRSGESGTVKRTSVLLADDSEASPIFLKEPISVAFSAGPENRGHWPDRNETSRP
jgi:hypothetical protein